MLGERQEEKLYCIIAGSAVSLIKSFRPYLFYVTLATSEYSLLLFETLGDGAKHLPEAMSTQNYIISVKLGKAIFALVKQRHQQTHATETQCI
ncbi:MAG TPA: hypothetical protein VE944_04580 [Nostoc sp.]|uniref:hypothetical protein n=1 Tax=Nostoc sp. TaxID=1180 RepID=UPI002D4F16B7|nr:hypothetical protein [Nostoc sp.]HYX13639.1 hypothetical protein [Nostoc sp.]